MCLQISENILLDVNIFIFRNGQILNYDENNDYTIFEFENFEFDLSGFTSKTTTIPKVQEVMTSTLIKCLLNNNYNKKFDSVEILVQQLKKDEEMVAMLKKSQQELQAITPSRGNSLNVKA